MVLRKTISSTLYGRRERSTSHYYPVSISCRTVIYKGMFLADQLGTYYPDLHDPDFESALALIHQRFSTNTFPAWSLAHPYRMIAHNGEINTLRGNVNWMAARQASVSSPRFGEDINRLWPISYEGQSDTACFDNALEFLVQGGYSLAHAVMMMIPEAWAGNPLMNEERRAFYEYHAALMEPWDGPAAIAFTNGRQIGATLDRNGFYSMNRSPNFLMCSGLRPQTLIWRIFNTRDIAATWASACFPVPTTPRTTSFFGERYLHATAPAAPVRISVSFVALITATGIPVAISRITVSAITVGKPLAGLPGWTLTIFTPAIEREGR
jgi:hypothetical protein